MWRPCVTFYHKNLQKCKLIVIGLSLTQYYHSNHQFCIQVSSTVFLDRYNIWYQLLVSVPFFLWDLQNVWSQWYQWLKEKLHLQAVMLPKFIVEIKMIVLMKFMLYFQIPILSWFIPLQPVPTLSLARFASHHWYHNNGLDIHLVPIQNFH